MMMIVFFRTLDKEPCAYLGIYRQADEGKDTAAASAESSEAVEAPLLWLHGYSVLLHEGCC